MSQRGDVPLSQPVTPPVTQPVPAPIYDDSVTRGQLDDLQLQESLVAQLQDILDEAGQAVATGAPKWVDPDVFGSTREGERMARHTIRAQVRVQEALDLALGAIAQHHVSLATFRDEVRRVEAVGVEELTAVRNRVDGLGS